MIDISDFKQVFRLDSRFSFPSAFLTEVEDLREDFSGVLFFDRLLEELGVQSSENVYPPRTNKELRNLHELIVSAEIAEHHKQSLLFYLLKDCRPYVDGDLAEEFARKCYMPDKYKICIEGLWALDKAQFKHALESLTHPSLTPTFSEDILNVLVNHAGDEGNKMLPYYYYSTVQPVISSPEILDSYFGYLTTLSLTEAFNFARRRPEQEHKRLLEILAEAPLEEAQKALEYVNLPFTTQEQTWFEEYHLHGKGRNLFGARETVYVRRIIKGRLNEALEDSDHLSSCGYWKLTVDSIEKGLGPRKDIPIFKLQY